MPIEIERRFLVDGDAWRTGVSRRELYRQGDVAEIELDDGTERAAG